MEGALGPENGLILPREGGQALLLSLCPPAYARSAGPLYTATVALMGRREEQGMAPYSEIYAWSAEVLTMSPLPPGV